jgi:hypothetical protein
MVHRYVAGPTLEDGVAAAVELNGQGIRGILDLLGEAVTDLSGASQATQQYLKAVETIADRGIDSTVSLKLTQLGLLIVGQQPFGGAGASGTKQGRFGAQSSPLGIAPNQSDIRANNRLSVPIHALAATARRDGLVELSVWRFIGIAPQGWFVCCRGGPRLTGLGLDATQQPVRWWRSSARA